MKMCLFLPENINAVQAQFFLFVRLAEDKKHQVAVGAGVTGVSTPASRAEEDGSQLCWFCRGI